MIKMNDKFGKEVESLAQRSEENARELDEVAERQREIAARLLALKVEADLMARGLRRPT